MDKSPRIEKKSKLSNMINDILYKYHTKIIDLINNLDMDKYAKSSIISIISDFQTNGYMDEKSTSKFINFIKANKSIFESKFNGNIEVNNFLKLIDVEKLQYHIFGEKFDGELYNILKMDGIMEILVELQVGESMLYQLFRDFDLFDVLYEYLKSGKIELDSSGNNLLHNLVRIWAISYISQKDMEAIDHIEQLMLFLINNGFPTDKINKERKDIYGIATEIGIKYEKNEIKSILEKIILENLGEKVV